MFVLTEVVGFMKPFYVRLDRGGGFMKPFYVRLDRGGGFMKPFYVRLEYDSTN